MPQYSIVDNGLVDTGAALLNPIISLWNSFVNVLPGLISAIIVLLVGYIVAVFLGHVVNKVLEQLKLDKKVKQLGIERGLGNLSLTGLAAGVTKWYVFILFLQNAVLRVNLGILSSLLEELSFWLPKAIVAVIIVLFGLVAAHFVGERMLKAKLWGIKLLTTIVRAVILFFIAVIALGHIGLNVSILENTFLILVAGIALGVALALGIGLGLGLKGEAENLMKDLMKGK